MENPYQAPAHVSSDRSPATPRRFQLAVSLLISAFCMLQFVPIWFAALQLVTESGLKNSPLLLLAARMVLPATLMLGGVFLAFGRKLAAIFFAAYLVQYLIESGLRGHVGSLFTLALGGFFLAYSLWLWKRGNLSGWPSS